MIYHVLLEGEIRALWDVTEPLADRELMFAYAIETLVLTMLEGVYRGLNMNHNMPSYRVLTPAEQDQIAQVHEKGLDFQLLLESLDRGDGPSREMIEAKNKLDELIMWAKRYIGK